MWRAVELPSFDGPILGFTFPDRNVFFVLTPNGLIRVALDPVEACHVADANRLAELFDPETQMLTWEGEQHPVFNDEGGEIPLLDHPNGDRIEAAEDGTMLITDPDGREVRQRIPSVRIPDDGAWMYAGFSDDYEWLIAGESRGIQVFRILPDKSSGT